MLIGIPVKNAPSHIRNTVNPRDVFHCTQFDVLGPHQQKEIIHQSGMFYLSFSSAAIWAR